MKLEQATCPLPFTPPFVHPWKRALPDAARQRLVSLFDGLLPGVSVDIVEWVGADPRHPIHAVVARFPSGCRPSVVLYLKSEDIERSHLVAALSGPPTP